MVLIKPKMFLYFLAPNKMDLQDKNSQNLAESSPRAPATSLQVQCDPLEPVHCKIRQGQNCNSVLLPRLLMLQITYCIL